MASNRTPTRFYGPAQPALSSDVTAYPVPANKIAVIRSVNISWNSDATAMSLGIGGVSGNDLFFNKENSGPLVTSEDFWLYVVLEAAEEIHVNSLSGDSGARITIDGDLYDV